MPLAARVPGLLHLYVHPANCDLDDVDDDAVYALFHETADRISEYWANESGDSMYIDVKRIAAACEVDEVATLPGAKPEGDE